jgi:mono/diheme cytochrome c family protein
MDADTTHAPRGNPSFAVPVTGSVAPSYLISYQQLPQTLDSLGAIPNPTPPSPASLENGRKNFNINCAVCHGPTGQGDGPATKYGVAGINLTQALTQGRTDGYIFGMIRNGRGLMPTYNRIEEMDRWDIVNYVRALQGKIPNTVGIGPYGVPGQNGATVPGPTRDAPTRPAPMWRPTATAVQGGVPVQGTPSDSASGLTARPGPAGAPGAPAAPESTTRNAPRTRRTP